MGLSATVSTLETTSGHAETGSTEIWQRLTPVTFLDRSTRHRKVLPAGSGSTEIWRRPTFKTAVDRFSIECQPFTAASSGKTVSDNHLNRKWKYGENRTVELAAIDFLFDPNTLYVSIGHRLDARNYFRFRRNRKYSNLTSANLRNDST